MTIENSADFELILDSSKFEKAIKSAGRSFASFARGTSEKIQTVRQEFTNYLINDLAGGAIKGAFEKTFEYLGNLASESKTLVNLADSTSLSVEALSKLGAVAKGTESDLAGLAEAAALLDDDMFLNVAETIDLDPEDLNAEDCAERLAVVVDALNRIPDAAARAERATSIFGDAAASLSGILDGTKGSARAFIETAESAGLIASDGNARALAEFSATLEQMKASAAGLANELAVALLPIFQDTAEAITTILHAVNQLTDASGDASSETAALADSTRRAREEGEELRKLDAGKFDFVEDLAGQGTLVESVFTEAASTIEELQSRYGDLGFSVDEATRSITAASDAQERFNAAAKEQKKAELEAEIAAAEKHEGELVQATQQELDRQSGFWTGLAHEFNPATLAANATGGTDPWAKKIDELNQEVFEERKRLYALRKELSELNLGKEPGASESGDLFEMWKEATGYEEPGAAPKSTEPGATPSTEQTRLDDEINRFNEREERSNRSDVENQIADVRQEEAGFRATVEKRLEIERSKGKSGENAEVVAGLEKALEESKAREEAKVSAIQGGIESELDDALGEWGQASEINDLDLGIGAETKKQQKFRQNLRDRISRSEDRGDDNLEEQDEWQKKIDASYREEEENKNSIREANIEIAKSDPEGARALEQIDGEANRIIELLQKKADASDSQAVKDDVQNYIAEIREQAEIKKSNVGAEIDAKALEQILGVNEEAEEAARQREEEQAEYFQRAYETTEQTAKGTAATFSGFDAAQLAQAGLDERALKEAERQTRLLDEIYKAMHSGATFA